MDHIKTSKKNKLQKIIVFQQNGSGESKIQGIIKYGNDFFDLKIISIDQPLSPVIDNARKYLFTEIKADLVLEYLKHPDLSRDLAFICVNKKISIVSTGKKIDTKGVITPPT